MYLAIQAILDKIKPSDRVLDLGGWGNVFPRADIVVDINPYDSRQIAYPQYKEHFSKESWICADFCSPDFWKAIPDKSFDFILVSHTLEDIRDPLYVCSQMIRCGRAGYIEAPSKFRECAKETHDAIFSGFDHHRWIIEPLPDLTGLQFKAKLAWAHHHDFLGDARRYLLRDYHYQFNSYFWNGSFSYIEHFPKGVVLESNDLVFFYNNIDYKSIPTFVYNLKPNSTSPDNGKCLWVNKYSLPSESAE